MKACFYEYLDIQIHTHTYVLIEQRDRLMLTGTWLVTVVAQFIVLVSDRSLKKNSTAASMHGYRKTIKL